MKPGEWIECRKTLEKGKVASYNGKTVCVVIGDGITLYASPKGLQNLGWQTIIENQKNES